MQYLVDLPVFSSVPLFHLGSCVPSVYHHRPPWPFNLQKQRRPGSIRSNSRWNAYLRAFSRKRILHRTTRTVKAVVFGAVTLVRAFVLVGVRRAFSGFLSYRIYVISAMAGFLGAAALIAAALDCCSIDALDCCPLLRFHIVCSRERIDRHSPTPDSWTKPTVLPEMAATNKATKIPPHFSTSPDPSSSNALDCR